MKLHGETRLDLAPGRPVPPWRGLILGILLLSCSIFPLSAEVTVRTLGGGRLTPEGSDAGFTDGDILQSAQFSVPAGCAVDSLGRVYVADRDNGALRRLDVTANRCRTIVQGLNQPVAVAVDATNVVYVLTQGDGVIRRIDRGVVMVLATGLTDPTAMAYDGDTHLFVTQNAGTVVSVNISSKAISAPVLTGLQQPSGIAVLENGWLAVSELGRNLVGIWEPITGRLQRQIGTGQAGFADGPSDLARLYQPAHLAVTPGGSLLVVDRGNSRVRLVEPDGFVTTLYGVDPATWEGPACTGCSPIILPGWYDGTVEFAEARDPLGVAVSNDGKVYTTETFYHLVREISNAVFSGGGDSGGTNIVVLPPVITPVSGYYPMGQTITVTDPNSFSFLSRSIYYTTDGSEPTTNSFRLPMSGGVGNLVWTEKQHDLTGLRMKAFLGANESSVVSGEPVAATEIGVPQDLSAGSGSTLIVPIVVNLRTNDQLKSLQFRVEITPETAAWPMIPATCRALSVSTNDFIVLYTSAEKEGPSLFQYGSYENGRTRGLAITYLGTNANLFIKDFGVAAMLAIPIPPSAPLGSRYRIQVVNPSGTANAEQQRIDISPMPDRVITVAPTGYLVGDSSPGTWYNAKPLMGGAGRIGFGDGILDNSDVNNAFAAALGSHVPYEGSDVFDALDAFPEDTVISAGGDGLIRFLDWQVILIRSLGLDTAQWERVWSEGGVRRTKGNSTGTGQANSPGVLLTSAAPGAVWERQVILAAESMEYVVPGANLDVPVYVEVGQGCQLAGLAFRATVEPEGTAPVLERAAQFIPSSSLPGPIQSMSPGAGTVLCGWPLVPSSSFNPPLTGKQLLGYLRVILPATARLGHVYTLRFANADGSPDLQTQYEFETRAADLWVYGSAQRSAERISEEWKTHFFGSVQSAPAGSDQDPDHDGVPNWMEYLAGTHPLDGQSNLHLEVGRAASPAGVSLRWLSAPGKTYQIETASDLSTGAWASVAQNLSGDGQTHEWIDPNPGSRTRFYRIRLQP